MHFFKQLLIFNQHSNKDFSCKISSKLNNKINIQHFRGGGRGAPMYEIFQFCPNFQLSINKDVSYKISSKSENIWKFENFRERPPFAIYLILS